MKRNFKKSWLWLTLCIASPVIVSVLSFADPGGGKHISTAVLKSGDLVFQDSSPHSGQAEAIKLLTRSKWSHCGIYFERPGRGAVVIDGNGRGPVISWERWKKDGKDGEFIAFRLKQALQESQLESLWKSANGLDQRPYDLKFAWDDERIYCSELIWKAYRDSLEIELCPLGKLSDFNLESELARPLIERKGSWGSVRNVRAHRDEPIVSPQALTESDLLQKVAK